MAADNNTRDLTLSEMLNKPKIVVSSLLLLLLMIVIFIGNLVVIRTVYVTTKLHFAAFYFVASLAVADFLVGFLVPVSLVYYITTHMAGGWIAGEIACDIWIFANVWFVVASLLNLCVVSWDRYVAVTSPFQYKLRMRGKRVRLLIGLVWCVSLVVGILYALAFKYSKDKQLCKVNDLSEGTTLTAFSIIYVIPTFFLIFVNYKVIKIARKHRHDIRKHKMTMVHISTAGRTNSDPNENRNKEKRRSIFVRVLMSELKTFKTLIIVIGTFVVCWTPFFVLLVLQIFVSFPRGIPHVTVILFYVKSGLNPLIYGVSDKSLRVAAKNSLKKQRRVAAGSSADESQAPDVAVPDENNAANVLPATLGIENLSARSFRDVKVCVEEQTEAGASNV